MAEAPDFNAVIRTLAQTRTQKELAAELGVSEPTISRYVRGITAVNEETIKTLLRLHLDLVLQAIEETNHRREEARC